MTEKFRASDATEWNSHGHMGRGKVRRKLTARTLLKGHAYLGETGQEPGREPRAAPEAAGGEARPSPGRRTG
ncbi:DUF2945 domain-containing protein [Ramlibacter rhizophilus]|uniref:DUF2945 domain-containing protein n=1 Tax=Ramlibacter rhizophilus TaxID=1781167 RepID=A0A4Z0BD74_9BURK|nr:DUF2945 domain-containing protein [Ramlibacter rhizophilus]TFY96257.1 DUF2945 domain-containing protein [Ramlibacter rhizophilus]